MPRRRRLIVLTFIESFATVMLERGLYFYTHDLLAFSREQNLWLALAFGMAYILGALVSHPMAVRFGEKRTLYGTMVAILAMHAMMAVWPSAAVLVAGYPVVALVTGMKWPLIESYISAGHTPRNTLRIIGRFNVSWASAVPLAMAASGVLIGSRWPWLLFAGAAAINVVTLGLMRRLPAAPTHLAHDHPERLPADEAARYQGLLGASRWFMLASYALLFLLAPLMPQIFESLGVGVTRATLGAALLDVVRVLAFAVLGYVTVWHGRIGPLLAVLVGLPLGFVMVLMGSSLATVLVGEVIFGAAAGLTYYAALYYAMVVKNASVDAGGAHEGLVGAGFALGPMMGLIGLGLAGPLGGYLPGMLAGVGPLILLCSVAGLRSLHGLRAEGRLASRA